MLTVQVEIQILGRRTAAVEPRSVELDLAPGSTSLRSLIAATVRSEVAAFHAREADRSTLRVLTSGDTASGRAQGKITSGKTTAKGPGEAIEVDVDAAIEAALLAHHDGLYQVVVDDEPVDALDDVVQVSPTTSVMFIRLVALSGA